MNFYKLKSIFVSFICSKLSLFDIFPVPIILAKGGPTVFDLVRPCCWVSLCFVYIIIFLNNVTYCVTSVLLKTY